MKLNKVQKMFMAIAGIFILIFQIYKFSEDGIEGYSWLLSILISVGLMLPIMGRIDDQQQENNKKNLESSKNNTVIKNQLENVESDVDLLMAAVSLESNLLLTHILRILKVSLKENIGQAAIKNLMMDQWKVYCVAYVYALICMCEIYKNPNFIGSKKYSLFKIKVIDEMIKISSKSADKNKIEIEFNHESAKSWAIKDIDDAENAINRMLENFKKGTKDPDVTMVEYLCEKLKIPDNSRDVFINEIRVPTKNILSTMKK